MNPEQQFLEQIGSLIAKHEFWGTADFTLVQSLLWASILCSSAAALLTATGKGEKWLVALLAAVPALALTAESSFSFTARYQYHDKSAAHLHRIKNGYVIRKDMTLPEASAAVDKFREEGPSLPPPKFNAGDRDPSAKTSTSTPTPQTQAAQKPQPQQDQTTSRTATGPTTAASAAASSASR